MPDAHRNGHTGWLHLASVTPAPLPAGPLAMLGSSLVHPQSPLVLLGCPHVALLVARLVAAQRAPGGPETGDRG